MEKQFLTMGVRYGLPSHQIISKGNYFAIEGQDLLVTFSTLLRQLLYLLALLLALLQQGEKLTAEIQYYF